MYRLLAFTLLAPAAAFQPADKAALKAAINNCCDGWSGGTLVDGTFNNDCRVNDNGERVTDGSGTHIRDWDTSQVTTMSSLFAGDSDTCFQSMNANITTWDTSNVWTMGGMFYKAYAFNQPLEWETGSVTIFANMFKFAYSFNQPLNWNVASGKRFDSMFMFAVNFNQPLNWDVSGAILLYNYPDYTFRDMFRDAYSFNQPLNWDLGAALTSSMFFNAASMLYEVDGVSPSGSIGQGTCNSRRADPLGNSINTHRSSFITNVRTVAVTCDAGHQVKVDAGDNSCVDENCDDNNPVCCEFTGCTLLQEDGCKNAADCWWTPGTSTCSDTCDEDIQDVTNKICGGFIEANACDAVQAQLDTANADCQADITEALDGAVNGSDPSALAAAVQANPTAYQMAGLCN